MALSRKAGGRTAFDIDRQGVFTTDIESPHRPMNG
jgi:hypothetical protein